MGQIKNIKLHIVTDIKSENTTMAGRQVAARAVNWAGLAARIPKDPKYSAGFDEMRIKFETAKGSLNATPETPVPIDWDKYRSAVKNQALVEKLHAAYADVVVPYPDTTESLAGLEVERTEQYSNDEATKGELESETAADLKSYKIMTTQEYFAIYPDIGAKHEADV